MQEDLELMVVRLCGTSESTDVRNNALQMLREAIASSTSSMTAVPKPLKFLRPHFAPIKALHEALRAAGESPLPIRPAPIMCGAKASRCGRRHLRMTRVCICCVHERTGQLAAGNMALVYVASPIRTLMLP